ncbi:hypothetical protein BKA70DRAFT_1091351 [Coprinopsis sp. MPI-PUGE-AT-0042]|nr:hypothetical protein BKA70DRAFT_1091351 [Coprinopsis sp. MPI-PUGE-AT-0042]
MAVLSLPTFVSIAVCSASLFGFYTRSTKRPLKWQSTILLALHTLYISYSFLVAFPPNVFRDTNSPLNAGTEMLRARYTRAFPESLMDGEIEDLFTKLGSVDMRLLYFRFGHDVVASCDYCRTYTDYALLALPRPLLSYIREMAFMGAMTLPNSSKSHLRSLSLATLMLAAAAEAYWTLAMPIVMPQPGLPPSPLTYWHDLALAVRLILFLLLPFTLSLPRIPFLYRVPFISSFLPSPAPTTPSGGPPIPTGRALGNLQPVLDHLVPSIQLLKYTRASIMRLPSMRERASDWWVNEKLEGDAGVGDESVKKVARGVGLGYDEVGQPNDEGGEPEKVNGSASPSVQGQEGDKGKSVLRENAKLGLESIMRAVRPSEHWVGGPQQ